MSIAIPLTAGRDVQLSLAVTAESLEPEIALKPDLGIFASEVVEISQLGLEKQQQATQQEASEEIEDLANEVIRISSSIGRARSINNLTNSQAAELYSKIASLS